MDLDKYSIEDLLLIAIRSEIDSKQVYDTLADKVTNAFLKDRLRFLAKEEVKHRNFLEGLFQNTIPGKDIVLPEASPVPLPLIVFDENNPKVSEVLESAMGAELAAHDFYMVLSKRFDDVGTRKKMEYLAKMELGHYHILELEIESMKEFEQYLDDWSMMHAGP